MAVRVCSLILEETQNVPAGDQYRVVRFRFGAAESSDAHHVHEAQQPDGVSTTFSDDRAGLIWPSADGWGELN